MQLSLTKRGDYGVRIMLFLAGRPRGERVTSAKLAQNCDISPGNVPTIVSILSRAHLLDCTTGPTGGCSLARQPQDISILEVIEVLDGPLEDNHCLLDSRLCHDKEHECALHQTWSGIRAEMVRALSGLSLADAVQREREIAAGEPSIDPA